MNDNPEYLDRRIQQLKTRTRNYVQCGCELAQDEILRLLIEIKMLRDQIEDKKVDWNKDRDEPIHWHKPYEECYSDCPPLNTDAHINEGN